MDIVGAIKSIKINPDTVLFVDKNRFGDVDQILTKIPPCTIVLVDGPPRKSIKAMSRKEAEKMLRLLS